MDKYNEEEYKKIEFAKWVSCKGNMGMKCSKCGARIKNSAYFTGDHKWCYKCGSKMIKKGCS